MTEARSSDDGATLTVWVPMAFKPRGGRKLVVSPDGVPAWAGTRSRVDDTLVKALARAFRWRKLLETGVHGTIDEIARAEGINDSYVSRILRLTLLAPDIVEAILDGRQPPALTLARLMKPFPAAWDEQGARLLSGRGKPSDRWRTRIAPRNPFTVMYPHSFSLYIRKDRQ